MGFYASALPPLLPLLQTARPNSNRPSIMPCRIKHGFLCISFAASAIFIVSVFLYFDILNHSLIFIFKCDTINLLRVYHTLPAVFLCSRLFSFNRFVIKAPIKIRMLNINVVFIAMVYRSVKMNAIFTAFNFFVHNAPRNI
nr:MAG TPA: hypothetical protein [Caudoviricetes sp.]